MAAGDKAAAAGLKVYAGTDKAREGYRYLNERGDELAVHMIDGGHSFSKITGQATPDQIPGLDAGKITSGTITRPVQTTGGVSSIGPMNAGGGLGIGGTGRGFDGNGNLNCAYLTIGGDASAAGNLSAGGFVYSVAGRSSPVTSNWVAAALDGSGRLGIQPSATRFKKFIRTWNDPSKLRAFLSIRPVRYQLRHGDGSWELGYLAEEVLEAGFPEFVPTDVNPESETFGQPISVDYARMVVPLLELVKDLYTRVEKLEGSAG
ncbi:tail fiber domain-containing protein [Plantibacter sp. YIM 135249]|uniref:tail fiber domain-containing protein n=1 Tax=Plantibacter sp. YIM 135249 TaxID=3423918 RepID=UPI003D3543B2